MIVARVGKFGPYVQRGESDTASIPDDIPPDELTVDKAAHYIDEAAKGPKTLGDDPDTGMAVYVSTVDSARTCSWARWSTAKTSRSGRRSSRR